VTPQPGGALLVHRSDGAMRLSHETSTQLRISRGWLVTLLALYPLTAACDAWFPSLLLSSLRLSLLAGAGAREPTSKPAEP